MIAAMVMSDRGELLVYTCQSSKSACDEEADKVLAGWDEMKKRGAKVVQVEITVIE
jgi:hypothetical protein